MKTKTLKAYVVPLFKPITESDDARIRQAILNRQNIDAYNKDALIILERVRTGEFR